MDVTVNAEDKQAMKVLQARVIYLPTYDIKNKWLDQLKETYTAAEASRDTNEAVSQMDAARQNVSFDETNFKVQAKQESLSSAINIV